jgi:hypothetical protein
MSLLHRLAETMFDDHSVLLFETQHFARMAVMHDDGLLISREPEAGHKCARDPTSA